MMFKVGLTIMLLAVLPAIMWIENGDSASGRVALGAGMLGCLIVIWSV